MQAQAAALAAVERIYLPQLRLVEARIARAEDRSGRASVAVRDAIDDLSALAGLADQLGEAQDTSAIAKARRLLDRHRATDG